MFAFYFLLMLVCGGFSSSQFHKPNMVVLLTDDQDSLLGGMEPLTFSRQFFDDGGVVFDNAFASTPVCCPSRASILSGRYQHNTHVWNNSMAGNCYGSRWRSRDEPRTIGALLSSLAGYETFYAGKYLNTTLLCLKKRLAQDSITVFLQFVEQWLQFIIDDVCSMPLYGFKEAGGASVIPPGWDWWIGLVGNSRYYNYTLSVNGTAVQHGDIYQQDYFTDVLAGYALQFIEYRSRRSSAPFFMVIAVPAPHSPQTPAPQYKTRFSNRSAPRFANFNVKPKNKHSLVGQSPSPLPDWVIRNVDEVFRDRWRCLLSVDDLLKRVVEQLQKFDYLESTFVWMTSDHGFHLGQFTMPTDKRQLYEFDLKVPLYVRSPRPLSPAAETNSLYRVRGRRRVSVAVSLVDLTPTLLDSAGVLEEAAPVTTVDGVSLIPLISSSLSGLIPPPSPVSDVLKRSALLVSYHGEFDHAIENKCSFRSRNFSQCYSAFACRCQDSYDNTYSCLREISASLDRVTCHFPVQDFWEQYDLRQDPNQLVNIAPQMSHQDRRRWLSRLARAVQCSGNQCIHI